MSDCRGDLVSRVRRGLASEQERLVLDAHLDRCEDCRLALVVAGDFDAEGEAQPGDAERAARIGGAVLARWPDAGAALRSPIGRRPLAAVVALAALVIGGTALGASLGWFSRTVPSASDPPATASSRPLTVEGAARPRPSTAVVAVAAVASSSERSASAAPAAASAPAALPPSAAALFRRANEARRAGELEPAIARYRELMQRFPASAEASLAHVSLGGLLLQRGAPAAALAEFDAYLARGSGQRLAAEAWVGRGQALRALGRSAEEAAAWRELRRRFPNTPYAAQAERRLDELE